MKAIWIRLFFMMVLMLSGPVPDALALKCAPPPSPKEEMSYSKLVFKGRLVSGQDNKLKFEVAKVWKGQAGRSITLASNNWTEFKEGTDYIVFAGADTDAHQDRGVLSPNLCGNTGEAASFDETLLGESLPLTEEKDQSINMMSPMIIGTAAILILLLGCFLEF